MRVFYGVNGEGLGHASRTLSVVEQLPECEIHIFTYGAAHRFLRGVGYPHLHVIDGLTFSYRRQGVDYLRSLSKAGLFCLHRLRRNIEQITSAAGRLQPELFVSDFEPSIARAAHLCHRRLVERRQGRAGIAGKAIAACPNCRDHCRSTQSGRAMRRVSWFHTRTTLSSPHFIMTNRAGPRAGSR